MKTIHVWIGIIALIAIIVYVLASRPSMPLQEPGISSKATSNIDVTNPQQFGQALPTSVSCSFSGSTKKLGDGTTEVTFSWSYTAGVDGQIDNGVGELFSTTSTSGVNVKKIITQNTTFHLVAADSIATSSCSFTASAL